MTLMNGMIMSRSERMVQDSTHSASGITTESVRTCNQRTGQSLGMRSMQDKCADSAEASQESGKALTTSPCCVVMTS